MPRYFLLSQIKYSWLTTPAQLSLILAQKLIRLDTLITARLLDLVYKNNYTSPVQNSTIVNLSSYLNILKNNIPEDTSYFFVAENTFEPLETRNQILKFVMEENLCYSVLFMKIGLLDVISYERRNTLVLSINGGSIQICTVIDGIITNKKMVNVGCLSLTKKFVRTPEESTSSWI
jgi:hypothetical protein